MYDPAMPRSWRNHPAWRLLGRPIPISIPFALFFLVISQSGRDDLFGYFLVSLIFSYCINTAIEANRKWVLPLLPGGTNSPRVVAAEIASFVVASLVGTAVAAIALHFTLVPDMLGSPRAALRVLMYSLIFAAVFLGFIYAVFFQRQYATQVREEAEREAHASQEMRIAAEIQQALLPPRSRSGSWYDAAGASIPCRTIGGDFFEYFDLPDGRLGFALADVAGKGPPAALLAAMVQGIFDSHARRGEGPAATLAGVNAALAAREIEARFATVFYGVLGKEGELVFSNAGHNPPVVLRGRGVVRRLETGGLMIGPFRDAVFAEETSSLETGDVLVVYSDGATDAMAPDGEQFGEERLLACLTEPGELTPETIRDRLLGAVRVFAADRPLFDDVTVLTVRYLGPAPGNRTTS